MAHAQSITLTNEEVLYLQSLTRQRTIQAQVVDRKGQILRSTPNTAPLICGACNTQPEGLLTMA